MSTPDPPIERHYTPVEIASLLRRNVRTVRAWLRDESHPLKGKRINGQWYVVESELQKYLRGDQS